LRLESCKKNIRVFTVVPNVDTNYFRILAAHAGEIFGKPIVIKQKFQDSDMYEPHGYMSALKDKFAAQQLDVQNSETGECRKMDVKDFCAVQSDTKKVNDQTLAATSNAINLRKIANADAPLLTFSDSKEPLLALTWTRLWVPGYAVCRERKPGSLHLAWTRRTGGISREMDQVGVPPTKAGS
jgi:hypothetical protein